MDFIRNLGCIDQFLQGLLQGSVLGPSLYLFYINNLAESLPDDVLSALFADDVIILTTAPPPKGSKISPFLGAEQQAQAVVDVVQKWSVELKISLNAGKIEVSKFSRDAKDAQLRPTIEVGAKAIKFNPTLRLLGTNPDRQLTFTPHMDKIIRRV